MGLPVLHFAILKVNAFLCGNFLYNPDHSSMLAFCKLLAKAFIHKELFKAPELPYQRL
jgi:hypothetical protein